MAETIDGHPIIPRAESSEGLEIGEPLLPDLTRLSRPVTASISQVMAQQYSSSRYERNHQSVGPENNIG